MTSTRCVVGEKVPAADHDGGPGITALYVDNDPHSLDLVEGHFAEDDRIDVRRVPSATDAVERLDDVDCVVSDHGMQEGDGLELLETVREADPTLPFVLFTEEPRDRVTDRLLSWAWTDYLEKGSNKGTAALLARRIRYLVDHRRSSRLARRTLSTLELSRDGTAVTGPDGTFDVVNRAFLSRFGYDREAIRGRSWTALFSDETVDRIRSTALPTIEAGWRWTGRCDGRRADGTPVTVLTTITRLDDGALAFTVRDG